MSMEMIDRFYAKRLNGEINIDMLQSRRRLCKIYDGEYERGRAAARLAIEVEVEVEKGVAQPVVAKPLLKVV